MAEQFAVLNGVKVSTALPVIDGNNRAFRYGDGLFESMRIVNGRPVFLENHFQRLVRGCATLKMKLPEDFDLQRLVMELNDLIKVNGIKEGGKARLQLFRSAGNSYIPNGPESGYFLEVTPYEHNEFNLNKQGIKMGVYDEVRKPINKLSAFKTSNSLLYIMAGVFAGENDYDDCLIFNEKGHIIEAISSNLFIVSNGVLYTPGLDEGCTGGTMRMNIINLALEQNVKVYECPLNMQNILSADEMFLTNAVKGIRWIGSFRTKRYFNTISKQMVTALNASFVNSKMDLRDSL